jgi:ABC-type dipeptide/oligopeptide/nickel transport system permease subunit
VLVALVAALRMALGIVIGISAGWSDRMLGRLSDGLIAGALSVPTLIAALIVITAVGFRVGVWAFVIGLAATGWAETAQLVRERTRTVKGQEAVEAARALGASSAQIVILHILPQVMPMIWMLLAFEVSHAVVTTAGLGFLGYYLGGAIFAEVDDFVYRRISEMPELGQMLATVWMVLDEPWAMVAAGSVVFLIVLAFNLVGEGLQVRLTRTLGGSRGLYVRAAGAWVPWVEDHVMQPVAMLLQRHWQCVIVAGLVLAAAGAGAVGWQALRVPDAERTGETATVTTGETARSPADEEAEADSDRIAVPGGHIWANDGHDPWRTRWVAFTGPMTTTAQWSFEIDGSFVGGPVIDSRGTLYQAASQATDADPQAGRLYAIDPQGGAKWEVPLNSVPVGTPALSGDGTIFVTLRDGIAAVAPDGRVVWQFSPEDGKASVGGPVVAPSGDIYFKSISGLTALRPDGSLRWHTPITESYFVQAPRISVDGQWVHWRSLTFSAERGDPVVPVIAGAPSDIPLVQAVVGADGLGYWQYDVRLLRAMAEGATSEQATLVNWEEHTWGGVDAGVTVDGRPWLAARPMTTGMGLGFFWGTAEGDLSAKLSLPNAEGGQVVGVDNANTAYVCMDSYYTPPSCVAFGLADNRAIWRQLFRGHKGPTGAAMSPGMLYVALRDGTLIALGDATDAIATP